MFLRLEVENMNECYTLQPLRMRTSPGFNDYQRLRPPVSHALLAALQPLSFSWMCAASFSAQVANHGWPFFERPKSFPVFIF
jgi:hypothetical protein